MKSADIFGYKVELNFDKKGSTHQTCCGGLMSLVYFLLMLLVVLTNFTVMRSGSQSLFYTHDYPLKEEEFDEVAEDANLGTGVYLYFMD